MKPVLTREELYQLDKDCAVLDEFVVGFEAMAVARAAIDMLGEPYGRGVVVLEGQGWNGVDGRLAGGILARLGAEVTTIPAEAAPKRLPRVDLVIDAAYGIGFGGEFRAPELGEAPVLAVDVPSGLDANSGRPAGEAMRADVTVTMAALKPGLLLRDGPRHAGRIEVLELGLDTTIARAHLVEDADVTSRRPVPAPCVRDWRPAVVVVAGAPASSNGEWESASLEILERTPAIVVRDGLGGPAASPVKELVARAEVPLIVQGDGLGAWGDRRQMREALSRRIWATTLVVEERELAALIGHQPGEELLADARAMGRDFDAVIVVPGPTTVVVDPGGNALLVRNGWRHAVAPATSPLVQLMATLVAVHLDARWAAAIAAHLLGNGATPPWCRGLPPETVLELSPGDRPRPRSPDGVPASAQRMEPCLPREVTHGYRRPRASESQERP
jgi:NAD(P)H-hydrate repair Nnr-like enzyme with NAD(P)H-hydrate epimerase domain